VTLEPMPQLTYDEARTVGQALHDHWRKMIGATPVERDSLTWADLVQFVARKARERVAEREAEEA
jgi:predicted protein tyrosine phosphatase